MPRPRLAFHNWPSAIYAIGDVHGCIDQLVALEAKIADDGLNFDGEKWLVTVGDYVDRGPSSRAVIDHVMGAAPRGFRRFALAGNHEQVMLDFLDNPAATAWWLDEGGKETLASYGVELDYPPLRSHEPVRQLVNAAIPEAHRRFIEELPVYLSVPGWLFVHAGIRPGLPLSSQVDEDLMWIRAPFLTSQLTGGLRVVHGHTPARDIVTTPHRIGIDTHCFHTGRLSAVRVTPDGRTAFLSVEGPPAGWSR
ncbi:MAG: metallophosphoesterase family protein [Devosia sp.]